MRHGMRIMIGVLRLILAWLILRMLRVELLLIRVQIPLGLLTPEMGLLLLLLCRVSRLSVLHGDPRPLPSLVSLVVCVEFCFRVCPFSGDPHFPRLRLHCRPTNFS